MKLSQIASNITEAFQAGNKARKKEAIQDTVTSIKDDVAKFKYYTGYDDDAIEVNKNGMGSKDKLITIEQADGRVWKLIKKAYKNIVTYEDGRPYNFTVLELHRY